MMIDEYSQTDYFQIAAKVLRDAGLQLSDGFPHGGYCQIMRETGATLKFTHREVIDAFLKWAAKHPNKANSALLAGALIHLASSQPECFLAGFRFDGFRRLCYMDAAFNWSAHVKEIHQIIGYGEKKLNSISESARQV